VMAKVNIAFGKVELKMVTKIDRYSMWIHGIIEQVVPYDQTILYISIIFLYHRLKKWHYLNMQWRTKKLYLFLRSLIA
jgi:hypothetical protein